MVLSDSLKDNYAITLQDVDGITIDSTNYKINSGTKISLEVTKFNMDLPTSTTFRERNNKEYSTTMNYTSLIGEHTFSGIKNIKFNIDGVIWFEALDSPRNSVGTPMNINLLNDMRVYNHKMYIKDYHGSSTTISTPIFSLCQNADLLGKKVGTTTNGIPVVITNISNINRGNDSQLGQFITYRIELEEDR